MNESSGRSVREDVARGVGRRRDPLAPGVVHRRDHCTVGDTAADLGAPFRRVVESELSIVHGEPLQSEAGLGALTLSGYLTELVERFATREAVVMHETDGSVIRWSYTELHAQASRVARSLVALGVGKGSFVAVLMTNRPEWMASIFGISLAGGIAVPLSTFSTPAELACMIRASCAEVLLFEPLVLKKNFLKILHDIVPGVAAGTPGQFACIDYPFLRRLVLLGDGEARGAVESWREFLSCGAIVDQALVEARAAAVMPADPAMLYFSSGSTGKPKGILHAHRAVAMQCWRWRRILALEDGARGWSANGFFWSGAFAQAVGGTLSSGGTLVLQPTFNAHRALSLFEKECVNYLVAQPHQYAQFAEAPNWRTADLSSLRYVTAGTVLEQHPAFRTDWREPTGAYGSTETFTLSSCFPVGTPQCPDGGHGVSLPGNTLKIVDPLSGETLPRGISGEIAVKGATLMLGYIGVPLDETLDADGFFRTGDGGRIDEQGRLFWEGRLNDIIKTGGANVSPLEIDAALGSIEGVKLSQTVGVPHDSLGEMVVSCVVPLEGTLLDEALLRDRLKERLASYKVPRRILFVTPIDLSFTGSEKVRTESLREFAATRLVEEN